MVSELTISSYVFLGKKRIQILGDEYDYFGEVSRDGKAFGEGVAYSVENRGNKIAGTWYNDLMNGLCIETRESGSVTVSEYDMGTSHGKRTVYYFL